jgi:hypothetical protein
MYGFARRAAMRKDRCSARVLAGIMRTETLEL